VTVTLLQYVYAMERLLHEIVMVKLVHEVVMEKLEYECVFVLLIEELQVEP
jgi:hypothetical protein